MSGKNIGPQVRRPAFGDNPDVDIVRIAAATSMRRLEGERDEARAQLAIAQTALGNIALGSVRDPSVAADMALVAIREQSTDSDSLGAGSVTPPGNTA